VDDHGFTLLAAAEPYSYQIRQQKIADYRRKRWKRCQARLSMYHFRKHFADQRPRQGGRFLPLSEEERTAKALLRQKACDEKQLRIQRMREERHQQKLAEKVQRKKEREIVSEQRRQEKQKQKELDRQERERIRLAKRLEKQTKQDVDKQSSTATATVVSKVSSTPATQQE
jgi:hypothetical protein